MSPGKEGFLPQLLQASRKSAAVCSPPPEIAKYVHNTDAWVVAKSRAKVIDRDCS
jgi:hypothetical protein